MIQLKGLGMQQAAPVRLYGKRGCPAACVIRDFLQRSNQDHSGSPACHR
jgi:hypothetical protein